MELNELVDKAVKHATDPAPGLDPVPNPSGDGALVAVKSGYEIHYLDGARKARRTHVFDDLASFARWLNRHAADPEEVEVLVAEESVVASLQPCSVTGDQVECLMRKHPSFLAWEKAFTSVEFLTQKEFQALVRANLETLGTMGEALLGQLASLQVAQGGDVQVDLDATGYTKFRGSNGKTEVSGKIPPEFVVGTPVIAGVSGVDDAGMPGEQDREYDLPVFLNLSVGDDYVPRFALSCPKLPLIQAQARVDAAAFLSALLADGFEVGLGRFLTETVPKG